MSNNERLLRSNDTVHHKPTGETWIVCGVAYGTNELVPCGWPPSIAKIEDCELISESDRPHTDDQKNYIRSEFGERFIEK